MIFRVEKTKEYTVMSNYHLREKNMSLKAKGLLSWMLSNDDGWDYSIAGIVANCKENETAIKTALDELKEFGYLEIKKLAPDKNKSLIHYEYIIHEKPVNMVPHQDTENLGVENLGVENPLQINTKVINTKNNKKFISKDINTTQKSHSQPFDFGNGKSNEPKPNLYSRCLAHIYNYTEDDKVKTSLKDFLNHLCETQKLKGENQFKGILKKLDGYSVEEQVSMIEYSIEHGYCTFYPVSDNITYKGKTGNAVVDIEKLDPTKFNRSTPEAKKKFREDVLHGRATKY